MLSEKLVNQIKDDLILGRLTQKEIAEKYSTEKRPISRSLVSDIATGRSYEDVGPSMEIPKSRAAGRLQKTPEEEAVYWRGQSERHRQHWLKAERRVRELSRQSGTIDYVIEEFKDLISPIKPLKNKNYKAKAKGDIEESAVLMLSDLHGDEVVEPQEVDYLEEFNFPIAVKRACHLVQEVSKWCNRSLQNFHFDKLYVFGLGDYTNGEIHRAENFFGDQLTADLALGELIGNMVSDLATHFPEVVFCNVTGNHGRRSQKVEFDKRADNDNHDTLIARIAELHCRDLDNVSFRFPDSLSQTVGVRGYNFHLTHGHGKRQASEVWSRAQKASQKTNALHHGKIDYFCQGHYHTTGDVRVSGGASLLANGAFLATDQYSYQSLQECGVPSQTLFGVHANNGVTWRLPIDLRCDCKQENRYPNLERFYK